MKENKKIVRDSLTESPWQDTAAKPLPSKEKKDVVYDVLIIGGGITGMTAALNLQRAGKQCILAEAHSIGFGTTGGTSAHINTFADTTYKEAERSFGKEGAQLFADAINEGFAIIRHNVEQYKIQCDLQMKQGYVYAEDDKQADELKDLFDGTIAMGVPVAYTEKAPTPVKYKKALVFYGQAQFHPLKYLAAIQKEYLAAGGIIIEHARVNDIETQDDFHIAHAGTITIKARHIIYATHIPPGVNIFSFRCAPYRSYVLGVRLADNAYPDGLVYDMQEPYHYFRTHKLHGRRYLIAGGNDHKTGHEDPEQSFKELERYVRKHYKVTEVKYKWSSQYYVPVDGFPYIGVMPGKERIYCATGYNGNGMMLGTIAGKILCDIITGKKSRYQDIFEPGRIKPMAGFKEFITENADVAHQFVASRLSAHEVDSLKRIKKGSGEVVEFEGKKIAAYRDENGTIHALSPVCTHAKCIVGWNSAEKSWDCPCHGARYDVDGSVLNGPADRNLERVAVG